MKKSKFIILTPTIPSNVATYSAVEAVLENFWETHIALLERMFAFVSVNQACFALVWGLKKQFPRKFSWVIPVPGEWHWNWHILQAIYKIWGTYLLLPLSHVLNYSNLDLKAQNFHFAEDFLQMVTLALLSFTQKLMLHHAISKATDLITLYTENAQVFELLYLFVYYLCPYWITRSAVKSGNHVVINDMWRYWLHLFIAAQKTKYTQLTIWFLWIMKSLHPNISKIYDKHQVFSFSGNVNSGIPYDGVNELV